MPETKTTAELFGNNVKTAGELFGPQDLDPDKVSGEEPNGDKFLEKRPSYKSVYENILTGEQNWDEFIPPEKRAILKDSMLNYEEGGKRVINAAYLADLTGMDIDATYVTQDQLSEQLLNSKTPTQAFERIKNRYNNGRVQTQIMDIGYGALTGKIDNATALERIAKLKTQLTSDYKQDLRGMGEQMIGATAEQVPTTWEAIKASPIGAGGGAIVGALVAAIAGQLGPQAATPEEVTTVPAAAGFGAKVGGGVAAANRIRELEAGGMYLELLEMKDENGNTIDPAIAATTAHVVGMINGGIELAEWGVILSTFGIGTTLFEKAATKTTSRLATEGTLKHIALKYSMKYGTTLSAEVLQELSQETTNIVLGELAKDINNELKGTDIQNISKQELMDRYYEVASESLKGFALLVAPGTIISGAKEVATREKPTEQLVRPAVPKTGTFEERVYMKGFAARLTSIRNNADNIVAGAGKKKNQVKVMKEDLSAIQQHYQAIAEDIEQHKDVVPQLSQIQELLPAYAEAVNNFAKKPSKEGFSQIKTLGDRIAELGDQYGALISTERVKEIVRGIEKVAAIPSPREAVDAVYQTPDIEVVEEVEELTEQEVAQLQELETAPVETFKPSGRKPSIKIREFLSPGSTVEAVVKESIALKAAIKKAAQSARKAFIAGRTEGIAKQKEHYAELKAREKTRKQLKARINKAVKTIKKKVPKTVDLFYRRAIERIQESIDPAYRTEKTRAKRQRMRDFLESATAEQKKDFPAKLAALLDKKTLNDLTVEELESIANDIKMLTKLGKTKLKARKAAEKAELEKTINTLTATAKAAPKAPEAKGVDFSRPGLLEAIKNGYVWTLRIPRLMDWMDGRKGTFKGFWHRTFYDQVNQQTNAELIGAEDRHAFIMDKMKELGLTMNDLASIDDFSTLQNNLQLSKEQQMGIYAALKNQLSTDALVNGNAISIDVANAVVSNMTREYKELADAIIDEYQMNYGRIRDVYEAMTNEDLGKEAFYTPIIRLEKNEAVSQQELIAQLLERHGLKKGYVQHQFTIDRKNIAPEHQKPMDLRLVSVWQNQVQKQEHFIHFSELTEQLRAIMRDQSVRDSIESTLGKQGVTIVNNYVSRVANPTIYKAYDGLAGISRTLRRNVAMSYLAFNVMTIAKQAPSMTLYMKDAGPSALLSSIWEFSQSPRKVWDSVRSKDPQIKNAFIERELEELRRQLPFIKDKDVVGKINKMIAVVGDKGMIGIRFMDGIARTIGWNAVYQKNLQLGLSEAEAVMEAQNATLRTQPAASAKDLAQLYATNEFLNWFTMFTNQLNNIWNITTYDMFAYWSDKKYQDSAMTLMSVSVNAMILWMLVNKKLPEDENDAMDAALDQTLNMLPLINGGAMVGKRGWGTLSPPPLQAVTDVAQIYSAKDKEKQAIKALKSSLVLTGVPVSAIQRTTRFAATGEPGQLLGGKQKKQEIKF